MPRRRMNRYPRAVTSSGLSATIGLLAATNARNDAAVGLFACAVAVGRFGVSQGEPLFESLMVHWAGITVTGLVLVLYPLSFATNELLWRIARANAKRKGP